VVRSAWAAVWDQHNGGAYIINPPVAAFLSIRAFLGVAYAPICNERQVPALEGKNRHSMHAFAGFSSPASTVHQERSRAPK
jgi:hypothetical protein